MNLSQAITRAIDFFYIKPLRRLMSLQTFRYAVCGGVNLLLNWILYALLYDVILRFDYLDLGAVYISRHIAAFVISFPVTFFTGYLFQSRISFRGSPLRQRTQLFRYALCVAGSILLNYGGLKLFVEVCGLYAPVAQVLTSLITVVYSYLVQKHFTFRGSRES